jgi:hypothetical protein
MTAGYSQEEVRRPPGGMAPWRGAVNQTVGLLQRMGFVVGSRYLLAVPARKSGIMRSTLVSVLTVDGERFIVAEGSEAEWVRDARAVGRGVLRRGRVDELVTLIELPVGERVPILRAYPRHVPGGVAALARRHSIPADADAITRLAVHWPVFRVERR